MIKRSGRRLLAICLLCAVGMSAWAQRVSFKVSQKPLKSAVIQFKKATGYSFVFGSSKVDMRRLVTVDATNRPLSEVVNKILDGQNVDYEIQGKLIVLKERAFNTNTNSNAPTTNNKQQTSKKVSGRVTDANGEPIIGATVRQAGTNNATVTDVDGNFTINAPHGAKLEVTYVGFNSQVVTANGGSLDVAMKESANDLNEVVVVGFGTQKKLDLTGAVATVSGEELAERPVKNVTEALQGVVPGLQITANSGEVGSTMNINIRGTATIGQGSSGSPLVLIDGVEGDINTINPQDIDNISVLKDAAASSIYGSRAPFGVILITTKNGDHGGKTRINYNNSFRFSNLIRKKHVMNSIDFASFLNDARINGGQAGWFTQDQIDNIVAYHNATYVSPGVRRTSDGQLVYSCITDPENPNSTQWAGNYHWGCDDVDWYDVIYKNTAFAQEHNASISGGTKDFNYYTSFNFLDNGGYMDLANDSYHRLTGTAKINANVTSWLRMSYNMRYVRTKTEQPTYLSNSYGDLLRQSWPTLPLYDRYGNEFPTNVAATRIAQGGQTYSELDVTSHQIGFIIEPIKNWQTHVDFNYRVDNTTGQAVSHYLYTTNVAGEREYNSGNSYDQESESKRKYLNFQAYSEYSWDFAKKHNFHVMAGFQTEKAKTIYFSAQRYGLVDDSKPELDLTSGLNHSGTLITPSISGQRQQWQTVGFFGRLNYNYLERYLFEANVRYDGTSRFRRNNRWKVFPSFSAGWRVSEESFMKDTRSWLDNLKLRFSYGSLGNQNTTNWYPTYQTISYQAMSGNWLQNGNLTNIATAPALVSTSLGWEKVETYNVGLDFTLLNNRLSGSFDYYVRNTKNMVGNAPELPALLGTGVPVTNNTDLRTHGWEAQLSWHDTLNNGFYYSVTANVSDARSKVTHYPNNPTNSIDNYIAGRYLNEIWGYTTIGIAKTNEEMQQHLATTDQSTIGSNWAAGDIMYEDVNGDGRISAGARTIDDHGDLKVIGNSTPRYLFGLDLNAAWKGFDFRAFFQGVAKRDAWTDKTTYYFGGDASNNGIWGATPITSVMDYFRDENTWSVQAGLQSVNTDAWFPRICFSSQNVQCQTRYLMNAAYMRLKNLQLGYTIPRAITQKWSIENLRVFFSAENVFTITDLPEQFDPEIIGNGDSRANGYPLSRTFSFGINITL